MNTYDSPPAAKEEEKQPAGDLQTQIDRRFLEEVERLLDGGYIENKTELAKHLGVPRTYFAKMLSSSYHVKLPHIRRLKDVFNGDYHYILFGVANPEPDKRGLRKPTGTPSLSIEELHGWIDYRFTKEIERMEREGRVRNRSWLAGKISLTRDLFLSIRERGLHYQPYHLVLFKQEFNADYHFILWGVERKDISGNLRATPQGMMRLDVYDKYVHLYKTRAKWHPIITDRREDDEQKRHEPSHYLDRPPLSSNNVR